LEDAESLKQIKWLCKDCIDMLK